MTVTLLCGSSNIAKILLFWESQTAGDHNQAWTVIAKAAASTVAA